MTINISANLLEKQYTLYDKIIIHIPFECD